MRTAADKISRAPGSLKAYWNKPPVPEILGPSTGGPQTEIGRERKQDFNLVRGCPD